MRFRFAPTVRRASTAAVLALLLATPACAQAPVFLMSWGGYGTGQFRNPIGIAVGPGDVVYVADTNNSRVQKFGPAPTSVRLASWGAMKARYR